MDPPNPNSDPGAGLSGKSVKGPARRSRRIKEAEKIPDSGKATSPQRQNPKTPTPTRVIKKPKSRIPKDPITPDNRTNAPDSDAASMVQDRKGILKRSVTTGHNTSVSDPVHIPEVESPGPSNAATIKPDERVSNADLPLAPFGDQSDTPQRHHVTVAHGSSYGLGELVNSLPVTQGHRIYPEILTMGPINPQNPPTHLTQSQPLSTITSHAYGIRTSSPAKGPTLSVSDCIAAKRLLSATSREETQSNANPHEYVSLVNVQRTSDPLPALPVRPPARDTLSRPSSYQSRSVLPLSTSVPSARGRGNSVSEEVRQCNAAETMSNAGQIPPKQRPFEQDHLAKRSAISRRHRDRKDEIPIDSLASHAASTDPRVGFNIASDYVVVIQLEPYLCMFICDNI